MKAIIISGTQKFYDRRTGARLAETVRDRLGFTEDECKVLAFDATVTATVCAQGTVTVFDWDEETGDITEHVEVDES